MGISTHILDFSLGRPAANVPITLARMEADTWLPLNEALTDNDGRCKNLLPESSPLTPGIYRIHFATSVYYAQLQLPGLYPYVDIVFEVKKDQPHYHVPLLLTANGYTTYRGS
jgi:5-hydroxyisourate hydrolase